MRAVVLWISNLGHNLLISTKVIISNIELGSQVTEGFRILHFDDSLSVRLRVTWISLARIVVVVHDSITGLVWSRRTVAFSRLHHLSGPLIEADVMRQLRRPLSVVTWANKLRNWPSLLLLLHELLLLLLLSVRDTSRRGITVTTLITPVWCKRHSFSIVVCKRLLVPYMLSNFLESSIYRVSHKVAVGQIVLSLDYWRVKSYVLGSWRETIVSKERIPSHILLSERTCSNEAATLVSSSKREELLVRVTHLSKVEVRLGTSLNAIATESLMLAS